MRAAKARTWTTAAAVAVFAVVATAWPAAAAPWPPADIAGVDPASPLLAPVDVELEPVPSAPAERAEITLALQPPRSWDGLLDLGISSGETPSLSETRVWGFFLGSADCVGLERLQVPDSTGDASFLARSLRHGVYFARNNPVAFKDPNGRESSTAIRLNQNLEGVLSGELSSEEFWQTQQNPPALVGAVAVTMASPGPEDVVIAAAGTRLAARVGGKVLNFFRKLFKSGPEPKPGSSGGPGAGKRFSESTKDAARAESDNTCVFCKQETTREAGVPASRTLIMRSLSLEAGTIRWATPKIHAGPVISEREPRTRKSSFRSYRMLQEAAEEASK